jgi:hypothetical protein
MLVIGAVTVLGGGLRRSGGREALGEFWIGTWVVGRGAIPGCYLGGYHENNGRVLLSVLIVLPIRSCSPTLPGTVTASPNTRSLNENWVQRPVEPSLTPKVS